MSEIQEIVQIVPEELVKNSKGLGIDLGGSALKFAYRSKHDATADETKLLQLRLVTFPKRDLESALEYVRERADVTRDADGSTTLNATGITTREHYQRVADTLNIKMAFILEDSMASAFTYLAARLPRSQLLQPIDKDVISLEIERSRAVCVTSKGLEANNLIRSGLESHYEDAVRRLLERTSDTRVVDVGVGGPPLMQDEPDAFPCLFVNVGSGVHTFVIEKDGTYRIIDWAARSGKSLLGLANAFFGCRSFSEFVETASRGNRKNVDQFWHQTDVQPAADSHVVDDAYLCYDSGPLSFLLFAFGEAADADSGNLKREDLANALLNYVVADIVQGAIFHCRPNGLRRVFFAGGFCLHPFVRRLITAEFVYRMFMSILLDQNRALSIDFDFVRPGAHLCSIGCMIKDISAKQDQSPQEAA